MSARLGGAPIASTRAIFAIAARRRLPPAAELVSFVACAGCAALVNLAAGSLLVDGCGFTSATLFPLAVAIAYCLGMLVNLWLNRRFTFRSDRTRIAQARTFVVVSLSGLALTTVLASLCRAALGGILDAAQPGALHGLATRETLSRIVAVGLVAGYSFAAHKYLTFHSGIRQPLRLLLCRLALRGAGGYD